MKLYREVKASEATYIANTLDGLEASVWLEPIEITEEKEIWGPGMDYFSTQIERFWIDSPLYGPTKVQLLDAWHKSFDIVLSKLKGE